MSLYNIEIFDSNFNYISSYQTNDIEYTYDYLNISVNSLKLPLKSLNTNVGDYIHITNGKRVIDGIVSDVSESDTLLNVKYKSLLSIFDLKVYTDDSLLTECSMEEWLANIIKSEFVTNADTLCIIKGLGINLETFTKPTYLGLEHTINNLYEIIRQCFLKYQVLLNFEMDIANKKIILNITREMFDKKYKNLEIDLQNILIKKISYSKKTNINKLTVINEEDSTERVTYYMGQNQIIGTDTPINQRIQPVISDVISINVKNDESFSQAAYEKACATLTVNSFNNLIEATVFENDAIVCPDEWDIGQLVYIRESGNIIESILTGIKYKTKLVTLIFGSNRYELTSIVQRRLNQ